jgi:hypothetical protein
MSGYVYVMTNSAMRGLVKIGSTNLEPEKRAEQLQTTGVPSPFKVYGYVRVDNPQEIEKEVHSELNRYRKTKSREFFRLKPEAAVKAIERISGEYEVKRRLKLVEAQKLRRKAVLEEQQEKFENEIYSKFDIACEKVIITKNFKLFSNIEIFLQATAYFLFFLGFVSCDFKEMELTFFFYISGAFLAFLSWLISKFNDYRLESINRRVETIMDELTNDRWRPLQERCTRRLYEKYLN